MMVDEKTPDERRVIAVGKQVLLDDRHFADAVSEKAAMAIADALEYANTSYMPNSASELMFEIFD